MSNELVVKYDPDAYAITVDEIEAISFVASDNAVACLDYVYDVRISKLKRAILDADRREGWSEGGGDFILQFTDFDSPWPHDDDSPLREFALRIHGDGAVRVEVTLSVDRESTHWSVVKKMLSKWAERRKSSLTSFASESIRQFSIETFTASFDWPTRGKRVDDLMNFSDDVIWICDVLDDDQPDPDAVIEALTSGNAHFLIGLEEFSSLEVKRALFLDSDAKKLEVCKDIAAFANASGGVLLYGAATTRIGGSDSISSLNPFPLGDLARRLRATLNRGVYPSVAELGIHKIWIDAETGIVAVRIPAQPDELKPFMTLGAVVGGKYAGNYFTIPTRDGEDTRYESMAAIHSAIVTGRALIRGGIDLTRITGDSAEE